MISIAYADKIFKDNLKNILENGVWDKDYSVRPRWSDNEVANTLYITHQIATIEGEVPIQTGRKIAWKSGLREVLAIYQSQTHTKKGFKSHSINWWDSWMNEDDNIGRAYSYNLESHRNNEMQKEVVKVKRRTVDSKYGEIKKNEPINPIQESIDMKVYFNRYTVIGKSEKVDSRNREHYYIQFLNSGHISEIRKDQIGKSKGVDLYERTVFGIGYLGNYKDVPNFNDSDIKALKTKWENIFYRCYSDRFIKREYYKDVFVHQRWHSFEQFLRDIRYVPQYHLAKEDGFKGWELDKDYFGSNCYSVDTCVFLTKRENSLYALSKPFTYKGSIYISQKDFAKKHGTEQQYISQMLIDGTKYNGESLKFVPECQDSDVLYRYELSRNQVNELLKKLKSDPMSRRHMISFFNWANQDKKMLVECAFMTLWSVRGEYLDLMLVQRSGDAIPAAGFGGINSIQYYFLLAMISHVSGFKIGKFTHIINNLHIYDKHIEIAKELLQREEHPAPTLWINPEVKDFYDFTIDDFKLINYQHGEQIKNIPIAI